MDGAHERSSKRLLEACLQNGGLYIKLGQGLVSLNHILPRQYVTTLKVILKYYNRKVRFKVKANMAYFSGKMHCKKICIYFSLLKK
jgi:hypothetical protein